MSAVDEWTLRRHLDRIAAEKVSDLRAVVSGNEAAQAALDVVAGALVEEWIRFAAAAASWVDGRYGRLGIDGDGHHRLIAHRCVSLAGDD